MSSEIIAVLILLALAVGGLAYLEMHSRRNKRADEQQQSKESD